MNAKQRLAEITSRLCGVAVVCAFLWNASARTLALTPAPQQDTQAPVEQTQPSEKPLPDAVSLYPEYGRYSLTTQAQQGDTCWAYSIIGCLELELSRQQKKTISLSGPYLAWAAARADRDAFDPSGSNFGRACRALERFGICERTLGMETDEKRPLESGVSDAALRNALPLVKGMRIDWIRFWKSPPGLTEDEMTSVKRHLAAGHPVAVGMRWPKKLTIEDRALCLLGTCDHLDDTVDGHCVTLVGYENGANYPGGGAFLIRNTWGPKWMHEGFGRLSFAYLRRFANDAISFVLDSGSPNSLKPDKSAPHNTTEQSVIQLRADLCRPDFGLAVMDDDIGRFKRGIWQSDKQVFCEAKAPSVGFDMDVTAPESGVYTLSLAGTKAPDYGMWRVRLDDAPVGQACDFCWPNVEPTGEIRLGTASLSAGKHTLRLECVGKSVVSAGYLFGLNWIRLERHPDGTP